MGLLGGHLIKLVKASIYQNITENTIGLSKIKGLKFKCYL
jgi:hypothetical protein